MCALNRDIFEKARAGEKEVSLCVAGGGYARREMDGSSLLALADLLKPPEEDRESDDVRMIQIYYTQLINFYGWDTLT